MKKDILNKRFIKFLLIILILSFSNLFGNEQRENESFFSFFSNKAFWEKFTIIIITAIISFLSSYVLARKKQRREPKKQLSYDAVINKGLVEIAKDIRSKIKILYNEVEIESLFNTICNIKNTGNTVIKDQYIRFEFSQGTNIIEFFFDPIPEREIGVEEIKEDVLNKNEKRFLIKHLEKEQQVNFRFILTNNQNIKLSLHPFNEMGDVDFIPRAIGKIADEKFYVARFLMLYLVFLIVPRVLYIIPFGFGDIAAGLSRLAILFFILPNIKPFIEVISEIIFQLYSTKTLGSQFQIDELKANTVNIKG